jgi:glycerol-3-phosphate acyltransferase PlsY
VVGKGIYGVDLRTVGSGNLGATNTYRVLGWKAAVPVMLFDMVKGWVPVWLFPALMPTETLGWTLAFGAAAIVGHVFSVWVRFKGGKGVATSAGVFLALAPWAVLVGLVVFFALALTTRIVSVGSLAAAVVLPAVVALTPHRGGLTLVWFTIALSAFVVWAHRANVGRLFRGEENRFGEAGDRGEGGGAGGPANPGNPAGPMGPGAGGGTREGAVS